MTKKVLYQVFWEHLDFIINLNNSQLFKKPPSMATHGFFREFNHGISLINFFIFTYKHQITFLKFLKIYAEKFGHGDAGNSQSRVKNKFIYSRVA